MVPPPASVGLGMRRFSRVIAFLFLIGPLSQLPQQAKGKRAGDAAESSAAPSFRCMRPFASLPRFSSASMDVADNCRMRRFVVVNASARMKCVLERGVAESNGAPGMGRASDPTCAVTLHTNFRLLNDGEKSLDDTSSASGGGVVDAYRFSLRLRALNKSVIHYKGFDGNGYSMCCSLIEGAACRWEEDCGAGKNVNVDCLKGPVPKEPLVVSCPLYNRQGEGGDANFQGRFTNPLHRSAVGWWEARLEFWRVGGTSDREVLGRLLVPFRLTEDDISLAGSTKAASASGAVVGVALAAVQPPASGKSEDL
uniref:Leishmanolysin-like peptidase n=1 Tax=Trypanosoma congolense (strain IL3000) TaxID=1068625 RepID=G0UV83_TRYCI|nr:conserved hypothetical protein [Trypanosoma congolense IL3000]